MQWMTLYGYARVSVREPEDKNLYLQVERLVRAGCAMGNIRAEEASGAKHDRGGLLEQLWGRHSGPLNVIWDNAPAHRGEAVRGLLRKPGLNPRLLNLPGYSPDFNADEAVWGWAREEVTGNLCLGNRAAVQEKVGGFLANLVNRPDEVRRRCRTVLQSRAESLQRDSRSDSQTTRNAHPILALV